MKNPIKNQNLSSKSFSFTPSPLLLLGSYWFYTSITFGYFLSKNFYNLFDTIHKNNLSKRIQFRKKLHLKNLIQTILAFCWKSIQNWLLRIFQKSLLLIDVLDRSLKPIHIFFKKVLKSPFRFKRNFRLFKILLDIFMETFLVICSFINECLFFNHIIAWLSQWRNIIRCLMKESISITYALYFILLGLFGIVVGFLLGLYLRLLDTQCGNGLVLITDSTFVFVKDVASNAKGTTKELIVVVVITLGVASGLRDINPESGKTFVNNSFQNNNQQVILVKAEGNPVTPPTNRGPSNFPTSTSRGRPSRPVTTPHVNRYPVVPRVVPGPGAGANPAGAGSGSGPTEFDDQCPAPKTQKSEASTYDYRSSSKKKKKESVKIGTSVVTVNSDSNGNPIFTIQKKDGTKIICTYEQALAKYYHADVHGLKFPKGFDQNRVGRLAPADRKAYIASTVPKQNILEFLKANVASLSSDKLKPVPGFIGARKESGTIYFSSSTGEVHFVNEMTGNWRTTIVQSESQLRNLAKNDFHLFPNAGE